MINQLGIDEMKSMELATKLNLLLCDLQLFYINVRGLNWNVKDDKFFDLDLKFKELYADTLPKIDEVAERILNLGHVPLHSFSDYLENATIKEIKNVSERKKAIETVLDGFRILLDGERELLHLSSEANDEVTNALVSRYIPEHEKSVWTYSAYLK